MGIGPGTVLAERYQAEELLGRGGMGEVWRCRDLEQGHDVAIKALRPELLDDAATARLFHNEVVAVARLNHPSIVAVYDLLRDTRGALLVMELRAGRDLATFADEAPTWTALRAVLAQILEALAYAHARGVLHLDIKPENVLVARTRDGPRATLLDFGIARIRRPGRGIERWFERDAVIGTVEYMAPEQCTGTFERFGPWTDLFSVGAVIFEIVAGHRPFPGPADQPGVIARLSAPPPRLVSAISGVPAGFTELCAAMLAVEPRDRPATAADVLAALRALDGSPPPPKSAPQSPPPRASDADAPTVEIEAARPSDPSHARYELAFASPAQPTIAHAPAPIGGVVARESEPPRAMMRGSSIPPVPAAIAERAFSIEPMPPPAGAYGLFGLRDLPVLGRDDERRAVWAAVRAAAIERRTRVVLLEGPPGVGKSRLARDAMERAAELGLCAGLQTSWSAEGAGDEGLRGLLENLLDTRGAPAAEVRARLDFWLDRAHASPATAERRAFTREVELLLRPPRGAAPDAGLPLRVALEAIARTTADRPALLWLDDVQWSRGEAAALVEALRARTPELPVCVIATVRAHEIADPAAYERLVAAGAERVIVDKLDLEATRRLVRGLLDVDEELCDLLAARAEGNPLFAGLLLRQLVIAEVVGRRDGRYRLTRSFDLSTVPADIEALLRHRIEQSGAGRRELGALALVRERASLEVAEELARAVPGLDHAIGRALDAGVLRIDGGAYVWEHGLVREHLVRGIAAHDAAPLARAAADALLPLVDREDVQEERAHHLRAAGSLREACAALLEAGLWSLRRADRAPRKARFETLATWAREARLLDFEARAQAELAFAHAEVGDVKKATEAIAAAIVLIERGAGEEAASWTWFRRAQVARFDGRVDDGKRATDEALAHAKRGRVGEVERLALLQIGVDLCRANETAEARRVIEEAAALCRTAGDRAAESMALRTLAHVSEPAEALALVERAVESAREAGALRVEIVAKQVWVDLLWRAGARDDARREARDLSAEAARRSLRQTVSLVELQSAAWAASEEDWHDARVHRARAAEWGAASGSVAERFVLGALDVAIALANGDVIAAESAIAALEGAKASLDDATFRDLLSRAAAMASDIPNVRTRLVSLGARL